MPASEQSIIRILHTSDWHIGRSLYGKKRYEEFQSFLFWLSETIREHDIDVLLIAGDVFDTNTPSNRSQELYYRFLCRVADSPCRHVVIIAGNHDSPSFLTAPKDLLRVLNVHVVGSATSCLDDEVLVLRNRQGNPELIVCAVPYLRDRDIRPVSEGESIEDKEQKLIDGIRTHYAAVAALAEQKRRDLGTEVPLVGMGHLFTAGGKTVTGDGVRELYVGSLAHVGAGIFPSCFSYLALGHLHVPQTVTSESIRYSGSPIPVGFGEAQQQKSVCHITLHGAEASVRLINIPIFQKLESIRGNWNTIAARIRALAATDSRSWLEVICDDVEIIGDLRERLEAELSGTRMEMLRVRNIRVLERVLEQAHEGERLEDLNENDVFRRCLAVHRIPEEQHAELFRTYQEAVLTLDEDDSRAE